MCAESAEREPQEGFHTSAEQNYLPESVLFTSGPNSRQEEMDYYRFPITCEYQRTPTTIGFVCEY